MKPTCKKSLQVGNGRDSGHSLPRIVGALDRKWCEEIEKWTENAEACANNPQEAEYVTRCRARAFEIRRCLNDLRSAFLYSPNAKADEMTHNE